MPLKSDLRLVTAGFWCLRLEDGRELIAMHPEEEKRENGNHAGHRETALIEKDVIEHDVDDDRAEEREAEWNEARSDEQTHSTGDLKDGDRINVAAADQRSDERAGLVRHGLRRNEMQEGVGPEDGEHEPEEDSDDDDDVFHRY